MTDRVDWKPGCIYNLNIMIMKHKWRHYELHGRTGKSSPARKISWPIIVLEICGSKTHIELFGQVYNGLVILKLLDSRGTILYTWFGVSDPYNYVDMVTEI